MTRRAECDHNAEGLKQTVADHGPDEEQHTDDPSPVPSSGEDERKDGSPKRWRSGFPRVVEHRRPDDTDHSADGQRE